MLELDKVIYSSEEIQERVKRLAEEINQEIQGPVVAYVVMKGAILFACDLVKHLRSPIQLEFISVESYQGTDRTEPRLRHPVGDEDVLGRVILIIEDIMDRGETIRFVRRELVKKRPVDLYIATLIRRKTCTEPADFVGFEVDGDDFYVGYGLDYYELYRNLSYLGTMGKI